MPVLAEAMCLPKIDGIMPKAGSHTLSEHGIMRLN